MLINTKSSTMSALMRLVLLATVANFMLVLSSCTNESGLNRVTTVIDEFSFQAKTGEDGTLLLDTFSFDHDVYIEVSDEYERALSGLSVDYTQKAGIIEIFIEDSENEHLPMRMTINVNNINYEEKTGAIISKGSQLNWVETQDNIYEERAIITGSIIGTGIIIGVKLYKSYQIGKALKSTFDLGSFVYKSYESFSITEGLKFETTYKDLREKGIPSTIGTLSGIFSYSKSVSIIKDKGFTVADGLSTIGKDLGDGIDDHFATQIIDYLLPYALDDDDIITFTVTNLGNSLPIIILVDVEMNDNQSNWNRISSYSDFGDRAWHTLLSFDNKLWVIGGECWLARENCEAFPDDIWTSIDGIHWEQTGLIPINTDDWNRPNYASTVFNDRIWLYFNEKTNIPLDNGEYTINDVTKLLTTTDGKHFKTVNNNIDLLLGSYSDSQLFIHNNQIWLYDEPNHKLIKSNDGVEWSLVSNISDSVYFPINGYSVKLISYQDWIWMIKGECCIDGNPDSNKISIYRSSDGVSWDTVRIDIGVPGRTRFTTLVYNDKLWIYGGYYGFGMEANDGWYTSDGYNWYEHIGKQRFSPRQSPAMTTHDNKIFFAGGYFFSSDIWYYRE